MGKLEENLNFILLLGVRELFFLSGKTLISSLCFPLGLFSKILPQC
jgi:hypothetical protein